MKTRGATHLVVVLSLLLATVPSRVLDSYQVADAVPGGATDSAPLSTSQLHALVAPIALYPDALVAQILSAATFPDQVAVADYWVQQHKELTGSSLAQAVNNETWNPSVKALTAFPSVLHNMAQVLHALGIILAPFVPDAARKIRLALGETDEPRLTGSPWGNLRAGARVEKIPGLFPRVEERKAPAAAPPAEAADAASRISIDEFGKIDLRVAQVLAAEPVPKSKKLLKLRVSLGTEDRTVLAGIAEHYAPGDLVGKKVVVVANLQPARLMGIESQGMVLAGSTEGGLGVLTLDRDLPPGAKVK